MFNFRLMTNPFSRYAGKLLNIAYKWCRFTSCTERFVKGKGTGRAEMNVFIQKHLNPRLVEYLKSIANPATVKIKNL